MYLITSGNDGLIKFWEIISGNCIRILFHNQEKVTSLTISNSGLYMVLNLKELFYYHNI